MRLSILFIMIGALILFLLGCDGGIKNPTVPDPPEPFGSITGKVLDENGTPVSGAIVTTEPKTSQVITGDDGSYVISEVKSRNYTVRARIGDKEGKASVSVEGGVAEADIPLTKTPPPPPPEQIEDQCDPIPGLRYDFKDDENGFILVRDWKAGRRLTRSDEKASCGKWALKLECEFGGNGWEEAGIMRLQGGEDWRAFKSISVDIWVPKDAKDFIAQLYVKTTAGWIWENTQDIRLKPDQWNQAAADFRDFIKKGDLKDVREFGLKIGTSVTPFKGAFFIDNIQIQ